GHGAALTLGRLPRALTQTPDDDGARALRQRFRGVLGLLTPDVAADERGLAVLPLTGCRIPEPAVDGDGEGRNRRARGCVAQLGVVGEVSDQSHFVSNGHVIPLLGPRLSWPLAGPFSLRNEGEVHPLECLVLASSANVSPGPDKRRRGPGGPLQTALAASYAKDRRIRRSSTAPPASAARPIAAKSPTFTPVCGSARLGVAGAFLASGGPTSVRPGRSMITRPCASLQLFKAGRSSSCCTHGPCSVFPRLFSAGASRPPVALSAAP